MGKQWMKETWIGSSLQSILYIVHGGLWSKKSQSFGTVQCEPVVVLCRIKRKDLRRG